MLTRRQALLLAPAGLLVPRRLFGASSTPERKFLFIYAQGGWDTTMAFAPMFGSANIDTESDATEAEANGIPYVDAADRPSVRSFFETWGDRACVINGMEVRSVTHERCRRMLLTGASDTAEDWGVTLASRGTAVPVPHLVLSGPAFASANIANVVRAGEVGQLADLLDGSALTRSTIPVTLPSTFAESAEDAFVRARIDAFAAASSGGARSISEGYSGALSNLETLLAVGSDVDLDPSADGCRRDVSEDAAVAFSAFERGLTRCAMVMDGGWCSTGWDSHSDNELVQSRNYEALFGYLNTLLADLDTRTGLSGSPLRDEVTIVVLSEMGRHPQLSGGGRAHWTFTSAMLVGAGIRGGQVIGKMNDDFEGEPVNLGTGELDSAGVQLLPEHLGATLLALGDVDPGEYVPGADPLTAALT